jgi:colanic acid/amylovoran biosynthesis glycosyltransferase
MSKDETKRRVGVFRTNFLPYSETFIHDELRHHLRYRATVFARQRRNADAFPGHEVVAVETIPGSRHSLASAWFAATARSALIDNAISKGGFDILHAHFGHNGVYALPYARRYDLPLVVSLHGRDVTMLMGRDKYKPAWWRYLFHYKALFAEADRFLAASEELKTLIVRCGCPESKVSVHRLGVDLTQFAPDPSSRRTGPAAVVMVGRFVEKKGHEYGIRAAALAKQAGLRFRLIVVGDGPLKKKYDALISSLDLAGDVVFPGSLPHAEVCRLIRGATAVMAPSVVARNLDRESGLIVAKEAAACGVPTIGTIHGGIPDIIDDGITGFLVAERDVDALGAKLIKLLSDEGLRASMGQAARKKMEREYDIRDRVAKLENIYDDVIQDRG